MADPFAIALGRLFGTDPDAAAAAFELAGERSVQTVNALFRVYLTAGEWYVMQRKTTSDRRAEMINRCLDRAEALNKQGKTPTAEGFAAVVASCRGDVFVP